MHYLNLIKTTLADFNNKVNRWLLALFLMYVAKALAVVAVIGYLVKTEFLVWDQLNSSQAGVVLVLAAMFFFGLYNSVQLLLSIGAFDSRGVAPTLEKSAAEQDRMVDGLLRSGGNVTNNDSVAQKEMITFLSGLLVFRVQHELLSGYALYKSLFLISCQVIFIFLHVEMPLISALATAVMVIVIFVLEWLFADSWIMKIAEKYDYYRGRLNEIQDDACFVNRKLLITRLKSYDRNELSYIKHCFEILSASDSENLSNDEIGDISERISKAIDVSFSGDENHDAWALEDELSKAYKRN